VKKWKDDNATGSEDEAEIKSDHDKDGVEEPEEATRSTLANLKQPPPTEGKKIIDFAESPQLGPVLARSVTGKDGKKVVAVDTIQPCKDYSNPPCLVMYPVPLPIKDGAPVFLTLPNSRRFLTI
jgi:hypothetical protein